MRGLGVFLRLVRFTFSAGNQSHAVAMANDLIPKIKQQPGCKGASFFRGGEDGVSGLCVLWDSEEHAAAAAGVISPQLQQHLTGQVIGQPSMDLFPVIAD
jgi:heme-degrading monooxygenase HmoA